MNQCNERGIFSLPQIKSFKKVFPIFLHFMLNAILYMRGEKNEEMKIAFPSANAWQVIR